MKPFVSLITIFFAFCTLHAQQKPAKFFAEMSLGPSFPIGQFGEKSFTPYTEKDQHGMAGVGMLVNATLGYYIKQNIGLLLTAGYSTNKQKPEGLGEYIENRYYPNGADVEVSAKSWKIRRIMAGGFLVTPLTKDKLNLVTKLTAGICTPIVPGYDWQAKSIAAQPSYVNTGVGKYRLPVTFCYQISMGLQYKLNERLHLLFDISSFNATATKEGYQIRFYDAVPDNKYKLGSVNALLGVGFSF